jgi:repressor LexA
MVSYGTGLYEAPEDLECTFDYVKSYVKIIENLEWRRMASSTTDWRDPVPYPELSRRQHEILKFLWSYPRPYSPSLREIGIAVALKGLAAVSYQIFQLEGKGWVRHDPGRPRALEVRRPDGRLPVYRELARTDYVRVPACGLVPAGHPLEAVQVEDGDWELPVQLVGNGDLFLLRVRGESMIDAAIMDGDWVAVRKQHDAEDGEIVVAMIGDEVTVKTLSRTAGRIWLMPQNPVYEPIAAENAHILGKVVAVLRRV